MYYPFNMGVLDPYLWRNDAVTLGLVERVLIYAFSQTNLYYSLVYIRTYQYLTAKFNK